MDHCRLRGSGCLQGDLDALNIYFDIPDALHLYDKLNEHPIEYWRESWAEKNTTDNPHEVIPAVDAPAPPRALAQTCTLLKRRALLFKRDRGYWLLTLGITIGFPLLVTIFAWDGIPQLRGLAMDSSSGFMEQMQDNLRYRIDAMETASLVTGLILFQVILLTLMGSNNGAREIAAERQLYEKERFAGLSARAYASSKLIFASLVAVGQGLWMMLFVKFICEFPGDAFSQASVLILSCVSMTAICLGFSALFNSADKASLLSSIWWAFNCRSLVSCWHCRMCWSGCVAHLLTRIGDGAVILALCSIHASSMRIAWNRARGCLPRI